MQQQSGPGPPVSDPSDALSDFPLHSDMIQKYSFFKNKIESHHETNLLA